MAHFYIWINIKVCKVEIKQGSVFHVLNNIKQMTAVEKLGEMEEEQKASHLQYDITLNDSVYHGTREMQMWYCAKLNTMPNS